METFQSVFVLACGKLISVEKFNNTSGRVLAIGIGQIQCLL